MPLGAAITNRVSIRNLRPTTLALGDLAALLHHAYGVTRSNAGTDMPRSFRAAPSGGALYPLEIYVHTKHVAGLDPGLHHFSVLSNELRQVRAGDLSPRIYDALVFFQSHLAYNATALFFLTAVFERSTFKYGARGYRFILLEAGHVAQNLCLAATALGLGSLNIGGYYDDKVDDLLGLDGLTQSTVYMVAIGVPEGGGTE